MNLKPERLQAINDFPLLLDFLSGELNWPLDPEATLDELTFDYEADELRLAETAAARLNGGVVRQLQNFHPQQPWGVFLVEFNDARLYRSAMRQILRGLVPNRRKDPSLRSWQHDNLLFICATKDYGQFTFAHFRGDKAQTAKLTTFGWQQGDHRLRTLCEFNLPALRWPEDDGANAQAWLVAWTKAFDKEPLTKDFFKRFNDALDAVKADLEKYQKLPSAEAYTRSQLLLERLIFLYFLQNRGWLNQHRNYLLDNFAKYRKQPAEFSYYEGFLERLFWTLASAPNSEGGKRLPGIPFLNGGLFDDDEFALTPVRRKNNPPLKIRNATFVRVFDDFLEAFNFTVREDTPLNQEVAVDPEMLGKVFESIVLHAEAADPDAVAPDKRKATGSYYTPRIVVHFICQEAMRQYLMAQLPGESFTANLSELMKIDASDGIDEEEMKRLKRLLTPADAAKLLPLLRPKCCDPSVGSGAFPVGLLHELVNLRRLVETVANGYVDPVRRPGTAWLHQVKEEIIEKCLYGVDIQQQAIEICQLRLWLSLVVDYDLGIDPFNASPDNFRAAIDRISQLPNLEMNFRRGDSLHDFICGVPLVIPPQRSWLHRADYEAITDLSAKLHKAKRAETRRKYRLKILDRRLDISQRAIEAELTVLRREEGQIVNRLFSDETESRAEKRKRIEQEVGRLQDALKKVEADRKQLDKLIKHSSADSAFYQKLRKLEGADFDSPLNFSWPIDLAPVFAPRIEPVATLLREFTFVNEIDQQMTLVEGREEPGGFDLIVGNPPFVTARNPTKRELYRERWKRVCKGKYLLVCPFFDLSFGLLRPGGQLGFIVSNAFTKREFGQPLIEDFFPTVDLQKVVDCSGLMFPGHGTPTCVVFGRNRKPGPNSTIRVAAILPGGGDLRTPPEESPLWWALEQNHDQPGYADSRIAVTDRVSDVMLKWPWNIDASGESTESIITEKATTKLRSLLSEDIGFMFVMGRNEIFVHSDDAARRFSLRSKFLKPLIVGEDVRNWELRGTELALFPYEAETIKIVKFTKSDPEMRFFGKFEQELSDRPTFSGSFIEAGRLSYEYHQLPVDRAKNQRSITFTEIATHAHFVFDPNGKAFNQKAPLLKLSFRASDSDHLLLCSLLNSSAALFWLKQRCFSKRESEEGASDTYFEFAGGKVEQLPVPDAIAGALQDTSDSLAERLTQLSRACLEHGQALSPLALKKLFELAGEAYHEWNAALPGYVAPHAEIAADFTGTEELRGAFARAMELRERLRSEMIALQEEMDWLVYEAYGLAKDIKWQSEPPTLLREQRPFVLWAQAEGDFDRAVELIPADWPVERRELWLARLALIRDNEHIRRIEQPVYKRRWDEQWKVGNRWQCGQVAYDAELVEAFDWWLSEKAEWSLERQARAVEFDVWAAGLWQDKRIQAAWPVVAEAQHRLELWKWERKKDAGRAPQLDAGRDAFIKFFKALAKEQTVPAGIPFGVSYDKLKQTVSAQVKKIRGKLNVPRERFWQTAEGLYQVAAPFGPAASDKERGAEAEERPPFD